MYSWELAQAGRRGGGADGAPASFSTTFPATENPISQGGKWRNGATDGLDWIDIQTTPGKMLAAAIDSAGGGVMDGIAQLDRGFLACASNQYSRGTLFRQAGYTGVSHEVEVHCNQTITAHSITGYESYAGIGNTHGLIRWNGPFGDFTPLAAGNISSTTEPAEDDVWEIHRIGNTLYCLQNGVLRTTAIDTTFMGGNPGLGNNPTSGATIANYGLKAWTCGSL